MCHFGGNQGSLRRRSQAKSLDVIVEGNPEAETTEEG